MSKIISNAYFDLFKKSNFVIHEVYQTSNLSFPMTGLKLLMHMHLTIPYNSGKSSVGNHKFQRTWRLRLNFWANIEVLI